MTCGGHSRVCDCLSLNSRPLDSELVLVVVVRVLSVAVALVDEIGVVPVLHVRVPTARTVLMRMGARVDVRQHDVLLADRLRQHQFFLVTTPQ